MVSTLSGTKLTPRVVVSSGMQWATAAHTGLKVASTVANTITPVAIRFRMKMSDAMVRSWRHINSTSSSNVSK